MKKRITSNWFWLLAAILLFVVYSFWFSAHHNNSVAGNSCKYKNGKYLATVEYYNMHSKEERQLKAIVDIENCEIVKIIFPDDNVQAAAIEMPVQIEAGESATTEDNNDGIYTITIGSHE
jgi:hypothetical protein